MTVQLNHTIVPARDPQVSARFLADILGLRVDPPLAHFTPVRLSNQVSLDYDRTDDFEPHHYAFMVDDHEFDAALARIQQGGIAHYGDPACREAGQVYASRRNVGQRGTYFRDPDGHLMELLTPVAVHEVIVADHMQHSTASAHADLPSAIVAGDPPAAAAAALVIVEA